MLNRRLITLDRMPLRLIGLLMLVPALFIACSRRDDSSPATATPGTASATAAGGSPTATSARTTVGSTATPQGSPVAKVEGPAGHDGDRTLANIKALTEIGPRVSGTEGEDKAVEWIAGQFRADGYSVEVMPFEFSSGGFADDSLTAGSTAIDSRRFNGSGTTDQVSGQGVFVGLADAAGLAGKDLNGKIAVADRGTVTFSEKFHAVRSAGAIGLIVINNDDGVFAGRIEPPGDAPVVGVSRTDRDAILAAVNAGTTFTLKVPSFDARNVIARPSPDARCDVIVGGHHDSVPGTVGATDNASGSATVVELARAFAVDGIDPGLCFVTFGGEESGLHGSAALVAKLKADGELPDVYVNLDVTGTGDHIQVIGDGSLVDQALADARQLGFDAEPSTDPAGTSSDHASFRQAGVPVVYLVSDDYSKIHTPADTINTINATLLDQIGDLAYRLIAEYEQRFGGG